MKQLVCEMCGSSDLLKQDGVFVCQHCGAKYSVEEAKKMMIDGTVDVSGSTVKVDTTQDLDNLYTLARRFRDEDNAEFASKYYTQILELDPNSWEASFYSVYYTSMKCKVGEIANEISTLQNTTFSVLDMIEKQVPAEHRNDAYTEINARMLAIFKVFSMAISSYSTNYSDENVRQEACVTKIGWYRAVNDSAFAINDKLVELSGDTSFEPEWYKLAYSNQGATSICASGCGLLIGNMVRKGSYSECIRLIKKIQQYEPNFGSEELARLEGKVSKSSGGCYVATTVYGSYDCPEVWTLRRFRDYSLAKTWYGRAFIHTYYAVSPTIVKWFGHTAWFKNLWKGKLDSMVEKLQKEGFESTPYEDCQW